MSDIRGQLIDETIRSRALVKPMRVRTYLPPHYGQRAGRYPVVYLLHPWGQDERYWTDGLSLHEVADRLIQTGTLPPFVAVMPQGDKSFFVNAADPGGDFGLVTGLDPVHFAGALEGYGDYGDYLLYDVIPATQRKLQVRTDRAGRALAGLEMGGTGAAVLAFAHPATFGAVGIHSPALFDAQRLGPPWIFGLGDAAAFSQRDPVHLAYQLDPDRVPRIYLDCGLDDDRAAATGALHDALTEHGITHTYMIRPGQPGGAYWQTHLPEYLGFYAAGW